MAFSWIGVVIIRSPELKDSGNSSGLAVSLSVSALTERTETQKPC